MTDLDSFETREIDVALISASVDNPRDTFKADKLESLKESIRAHGLQQPLVVRAVLADGLGDESVPHRYLIVAGERRFRAVCALGWQSVPCRIYKDAITDKDAAVATVVENVDREDLSTYELARACATLSGKYGMTGDQAGAVVHRTKFYVNNLLRCLRQLDPKVVADWKAGHDKATTDNLTKLAGLKDNATQLKYWQMLRDGQDPFAVVEDDAPEGSGDDEKAPGASGEGDGPVPPKKVKADTARALEVAEALAAYKKAGGKDGVMATEVVRYILGKRKTNPIAVPDKVKELEKAADDILAKGVPLLKAPKGKEGAK